MGGKKHSECPLTKNNWVGGLKKKMLCGRGTFIYSYNWELYSCKNIQHKPLELSVRFKIVSLVGKYERKQKYILLPLQYSAEHLFGCIK